MITVAFIAFSLGAMFGCIVTVVATLIDGRIAEKTLNKMLRR